MSAQVIPFPQPPEKKSSVEVSHSAIDRLSEEFLKHAAQMHGDGEAGADIYMGMIMALCTLVCRKEDDPLVIERKLAASYAHMLRAQRMLAEKIS